MPTDERWHLSTPAVPAVVRDEARAAAVVAMAGTTSDSDAEAPRPGTRGRRPRHINGLAAACREVQTAASRLSGEEPCQLFACITWCYPMLLCVWKTDWYRFFVPRLTQVTQV
jgi:hypothetical protein